MTSPPPSTFVRQGGAWAMADELTFIDHIGRWASASNATLTVSQKLDLVRGYREGLALRARWDNLDQQQLEQYVNREIDRLLGLPLTQIL
jgi:hypothetical protein